MRADEDIDIIECINDGEDIDMVRGNIYMNEEAKRIKYTPNKRGKWQGDRGTSFFEITDNTLLEKLKRYDCIGIEYCEYQKSSQDKTKVKTV